MFLDCSTCFERHNAYHRELKNCNCSPSFYIRLWFPAAVMAEWELKEFPFNHDSCRQPQTYVKRGAAITVFELPMMRGVSLETCWGIKKHWNNKFYYTVASCCLFLYDLTFTIIEPWFSGSPVGKLVTILSEPGLVDGIFTKESTFLVFIWTFVVMLVRIQKIIL